MLVGLTRGDHPTVTNIKRTQYHALGSSCFAKAISDLLRRIFFCDVAHTVFLCLDSWETNLLLLPNFWALLDNGSSVFPC
jgi:hypothetical protein